jgi:4-amino-4-deoxy-L-arabinose transferase-like glycosyltransferase
MPDPSIEVPTHRAPHHGPLVWAVGVFLVAAGWFGFRLGAEPHFVDESAFYAQSFYADLLLEGRRDDPAWLDYGGYDLPPLPKYLIGLSLRIGGYRRPGPAAAWDWYRNTKRRFETPDSLIAARIPSVLFGALGCVAIFALGSMAFGRRAGLIAATLLMISPLYRTHARRAMSDVTAEACILMAMAFGLAAWMRWVDGKGGWRAWIGMTIGAGVCAGLAALSKLNGSLAVMILGAWVVLGVVIDRVPIRSRLALGLATLMAASVAFGTFAALNPFLTAHPRNVVGTPLEGLASASFWTRVDKIAEHRIGVSSNAKDQFPDDALRTPLEKLSAVAVQGYGRFSPLGPRHDDSTRRYEWRQDWGAIVWLPLVLSGLVVAVIRGRNQSRRGEPPTGWAIALAALLTFLAVTSFIPLAWNRYYLSLQPGAILLASAAVTAPFARRDRAGAKRDRRGELA